MSDDQINLDYTNDLMSSGNLMSSGAAWAKNRLTHDTDGTQFVLISPKVYRCPKHGETDQAIHFVFLDKKYCTYCWHDWMADNIPTLEDLP